MVKYIIGTFLAYFNRKWAVPGSGFKVKRLSSADILS